MLKLNESKLLKELAKVKNSEDVVEVIKNIEHLEDWINTEMFSQLNKDYTKSEKKMLKEFKKLVKREVKKEDNYREISKGIFIDSGMTNYLNGYWCVSLNKTDIDLSLPQSKQTMNVSQLYYDYEDLYQVGVDNKLIEIEYKKFKKGMVGLKGNKRNEYKKENGTILLTGFNSKNESIQIKIKIKYLYEFSKIFNLEECEIGFKNRVSPLEIKDNNGNKGIILPIR